MSVKKDGYWMFSPSGKKHHWVDPRRTFGNSWVKAVCGLTVGNFPVGWRKVLRPPMVPVKACKACLRSPV